MQITPEGLALLKRIEIRLWADFDEYCPENDVLLPNIKFNTSNPPVTLSEIIGNAWYDVFKLIENIE